MSTNDAEGGDDEISGESVYMRFETEKAASASETAGEIAAAVRGRLVLDRSRIEFMLSREREMMQKKKRAVVGGGLAASTEATHQQKRLRPTLSSHVTLSEEAKRPGLGETMRNSASSWSEAAKHGKSRGNDEEQSLVVCEARGDEDEESASAAIQSEVDEMNNAILSEFRRQVLETANFKGARCLLNMKKRQILNSKTASTSRQNHHSIASKGGHISSEISVRKSFHSWLRQCEV